MLIATALAQMVGVRTSPFLDARATASARPLAVRQAAAPLGWLLGCSAAVSTASSLWTVVDALLPSPVSLLAGIRLLSFALGASLACVLVAWIAQVLLPRAAAIAASGIWLLLSCRVAASPSGWLDGVVAFATFPVSPSLLPVDEAARLGSAWLATGSVVSYDLGLLALLLTIEMRGPR